jgi:tetratricopeptide (TPR) repeat protein
MGASRILINLVLILFVCATALAYSDIDTKDCSSYGTDPNLRIEACNRILADASIPANVRAAVHIKLGEAYIIKRDYERALPEYEQGIRLNPGNWEGYNGRGVLFDKMGQHDRAFKDYDKATQLNPAHPWPWINRCEGNIKLDRMVEATFQCNKLLELDKSAMSFNLHGVLNIKLGKMDSAIADFDEAIRQNPKNANAFYGRGLAKQKKGDQPGGAADSAAATAIKPDIAKNYYEDYKVN